MHKEIKRLFQASLEDKEFLLEIYAADGDTPAMCSSNEKATGFALMYYGWCVGKGKWEQIKIKIK